MRVDVAFAGGLCASTVKGPEYTTSPEHKWLYQCLLYQMFLIPKASLEMSPFSGSYGILIVYF